MTVTTEFSGSAHLGNGVTTVFGFGFDYLSPSEIVVFVNEILQVPGAGYNLDLLSSAVVFITAPALWARIEIRREVPYLQQTSFRTQGDFSPKVHEDQFDRLVFQTQQLKRLLDTLAARVATIEALHGIH